MQHRTGLSIDEETCKRKRKYKKKTAKRNLKWMQTNVGSFHGHIYRCRVCDYWHLTRWKKNDERLKKRDNSI